MIAKVPKLWIAKEIGWLRVSESKGIITPETSVL